MPATIQVVLQQDMANLGKSGELVRVRPGYARNYLIPRLIAVPATERNVARIEHEKRIATAKAAKAKAEAQAGAEKLNGVTVTIERKAGEEDRLFGSVTAKDIEAALKEKGLVVERKKIVLTDAIRTVGTHEVTAKLASDITATFKVEVVKKG